MVITKHTPDSNTPTIERREDYWHGRFRAMASPCEILVKCDDIHQASLLIKLAAAEALRIEQTYSRYRQDNIIHTINNSKGEPVEVDAETARLLNFADQCYTMSDGLFDITSGTLRKFWKFDGSDQIPSRTQIKKLLHLIGWDKALWHPPYLTIPQGMEIDFGGIGKEYAVDRVVGLLTAQTRSSFLVNFGGDLCANQPRQDSRPWLTGIENPFQPDAASNAVELYKGAIATSGDARRFLLKNGIRYSHILNPKTGWPVVDAPRSVTVAAPTCIEAGTLSTLAMLQGKAAESFLAAQSLKYWCIR